jgi:SepF-like predicted cell division protein (DUF552 family)
LNANLESLGKFHKRLIGSLYGRYKLTFEVKKRLTSDSNIKGLERKELPNFGRFRKPKKEETEEPAVQKPVIETPPEPNETQVKTYLKAMPLRELADLEVIEDEVKNGNIIILRITPLASKSIEDVKQAVNKLYEFAESINGDIARLGDERVVICPDKIRIWREKTPVRNEPIPTAA